MNECIDCGLVIVTPNPQYIKCYRYQKEMDITKPRGWNCLYFFKRIIESGKVLTAYQHYLLRNDEIERAK